MNLADYLIALGSSAHDKSEYNPKEYVYGLFRRGAVNLIHGPSGVGKTRILLELESAAREGRSFLGYSGLPVENTDDFNPEPNILFLLRDRPMSDYLETLESMGLEEDFVRMIDLPDLFDADAADRIEDYIKRYRNPALVIVEGLDQTMTSIVKRPSLIAQFKRMQAIAERTGCAIVGTWGAPKRQSNPREAYQNTRDAAAGGSDVARFCSTMIGLQFEYEPARGHMFRGKTGRIVATVDFRSSEPKLFHLKYEKGRLVEAPKIAVKISPYDSLSYEEAKRQAQEMLETPKATFYRRRPKPQ